MNPATWPRADKASERLLVLDADTGDMVLGTTGELASRLRPHDVVVVNDAATLPGSLRATAPSGERFELRLAAYDGGSTFRAIAFGEGDHRVPTEARGPAPTLRRGDAIGFERGLDARVDEVDEEHPRLVVVTFAGEAEAFWPRLGALGRPIQYSYVDRPLSLWHVETLFAARPWAAEMPSAGRWLTHRALRELAARGVEVARLTHGAGLSSTGDASLDARLPLPERYEIPSETTAAIERARAQGGRVVAVGTSVARALETCVRRGGGAVAPGAGTTDLVLGPLEPARLVDVILTGMHEPGTSHFELLAALAPREHLTRAFELASREGLLLHEFGDAMLVTRRGRPRLPDAA